MSNVQHLIKKSKAKINELGFFGFTALALKKITSKNASSMFKKANIVEYYKFTELKEAAPALSEPTPDSRIAWFIPDFGIGSGGHLNIFRMIHNLEKIGIPADIYIIEASQWGTESEILNVINTHFFKLNSGIFVIKSDKVSEINKNYDIAIATSWQTAYYVRAFSRCRKKAYFVQDFEPYFFPKGSNYFFAEQTYSFGFYGITAGEWLKEKLTNEYGMQCMSFGFSYDKELYTYNRKKESEVKRVFFYARPPTERRGFELGIMALNKLASLVPDLEVVFAGWDVSNYQIPFRHVNKGVVSLDQLNSLYSSCDLALIISFTNLSLLPLEVMASGCPVVTNKGRNNDWIDENEMFIYSEMEVNKLASTMADVLSGRIDPQPHLDRALKYLQTASWQNEADKVNNIIKELLR